MGLYGWSEEKWKATAATLESLEAINKTPLDSDYCFKSKVLIEGSIIDQNDKR